MPKGVYVRTLEHRKRLSERMQEMNATRVLLTGAKHHLWIGDDIGYRGLHKWVQRHKGPACNQKCDCGKQAAHWANVSGKYLRELDDYEAMCVSCHHRYDGSR